jgi:hypothetical protein
VAPGEQHVIFCCARAADAQNIDSKMSIFFILPFIEEFAKQNAYRKVQYAISSFSRGPAMGVF